MLAGSMSGLKFTLSQCPKVGVKGRFAALALTLPSWIGRSGDLDSGKRDRGQYGQVAQRKSLRFLDGIKPQQPNQWAAGAKLPHTQGGQSRGNDFTSSGDGAGQNQYPLGLLLPQKTRSVRCSKGNDSDRKEIRLSDLSPHQKGPRLPRTRSAHL